MSSFGVRSDGRFDARPLLDRLGGLPFAQEKLFDLGGFVLRFAVDAVEGYEPLLAVAGQGALADLEHQAQILVVEPPVATKAIRHLILPVKFIFELV